jgi:hypothetical protein
MATKRAQELNVSSVAASVEAVGWLDYDAYGYYYKFFLLLINLLLLACSTTLQELCDDERGCNGHLQI